MFLHTSESQSNESRNLKQVQNSSSNVYDMRKEYENTGEKQNNDELMSLFNLQQNYDILKTVSVSKPAYFAFLYQPRQINDIVHFCCTDINATTLAIDATFNLCNLWVTDTTYHNKRFRNILCS